MHVFLFCESSAYISEFLTYNNGAIVYLMCLYLDQASKGAGLEFLAFNIMILYMNLVSPAHAQPRPDKLLCLILRSGGAAKREKQRARAGLAWLGCCYKVLFFLGGINFLVVVPSHFIIGHTYSR